jgi:hypothetical protein
VPVSPLPQPMTYWSPTAVSSLIDVRGS